MAGPRHAAGLRSLLSQDTVLELAGPAAVARGAAYQRDGRVELASVDQDRVEAVVRGSLPYTVKLSARGGSLRWSCTCPVGDDGAFCKHCVAAALSLGGATNPAPERRKSRSKLPNDDVDLHAFLQTLHDQELVDLLLEQVEQDWRLRERLTGRALAARGSSIDEIAWRRQINSVFAPRRDFIAYDEAPTWAAGVDDMLTGLEEQLQIGHATAVIPLLEHAHRQAEKAMEHIDDSDGWLTGISERIGDLHHRACQQAAPDPVELARRLIDLELKSELDTFHRAAATYAEVLGSAGLAEYRRSVDPKWRRLDPESDQWSQRRFRVREAMIGIALGADDPDELIRIKQHDLRSPHDYQEIVEALHTADRADEAIQWAHLGLDESTDRPWQNASLRELLAELLRDRGDTAGAVDLFWSAFTTHPSLDAYRRLLTEADTVRGRHHYQQRARKALQDRVRERRSQDQEPRSIVSVAPASALIEILLYEGDIDAAWSIAVDHGCEQRLWLNLARARETSHPLQSIPIYEGEVFAQIDTKKNSGYRSATKYLERIHRLAVSGGKPELFDHLVTEVRTKHKAKRNLMALLDTQGW
jgi:uncharacterized Zn finger protein